MKGDLLSSSIRLNIITLICQNIFIIELPDNILNYFSKRPLSPQFSIPEVIDNSGHQMHEEVTDLLENIDKPEIEKIKVDQSFQSFNNNLDDHKLNNSAKEWWLIKKLQTLIPQKRLALLRNQSNVDRPLPYNHEALSDLELNSDLLVNMNSFRIKGNHLIRNKYGFTLTLPREQFNSQSWIFKALKENGTGNIFIRPDPLMYSSSNSFIVPVHHMDVYGKSFNWDEILRAKNEIHGRWMPNNLDSTTRHTDFVWSPRNDEIHFICEEIPSNKNIDLRGSRYFHAIFSKKENAIIHVDGAIRIYNKNEWEKRKTCHVRKCGKIGKRIKIFLIDKHLPVKEMINICVNYFVWNDDLIRYFN